MQNQRNESEYEFATLADRSKRRESADTVELSFPILLGQPDPPYNMAQADSIKIHTLGLVFGLRRR